MLSKFSDKSNVYAFDANGENIAVSIKKRSVFLFIFYLFVNLLVIKLFLLDYYLLYLHHAEAGGVGTYHCTAARTGRTGMPKCLKEELVLMSSDEKTRVLAFLGFSLSSKFDQ